MATLPVPNLIRENLTSWIIIPVPLASDMQARFHEKSNNCEVKKLKPVSKRIFELE
jgi:hypothetical protein